MTEQTEARCQPGDIIPMSIGTAFEHINGCMRRRGYIHSVSGEQTEQGYRFTVQRLGQYRMPVDIPVTFTDMTIESPVTEMMLAQYAIAVGLGRRDARPAEQCRSLMRQTSLYRGSDGHYHITGVEDRIVPTAPAIVRPVRPGRTNGSICGVTAKDRGYSATLAIFYVLLGALACGHS